MSRTLVLAVLTAGYAAVFVRVPGLDGRDRFDPLSPRGRQIEQAIETGRFLDALPMALDAQTSYRNEPLVAFWLGEIYRGLGRSADEMQAWERVRALSRAPGAACPEWPEAQERAGRTDGALAAFARCAEEDPRNPERHIDLAAALERHARADDALTAYKEAAAVDPHDPRIREHIAALSDGGAEQ